MQPVLGTRSADRHIQAAKAWENHVAENGEPEDHAKAKEIM